MKTHTQPCPYCFGVFEMEPMSHTEGDLVLCPTCGVALRYKSRSRTYKRMSIGEWFELTRAEQNQLITTRRTLALTHVMTDDWRYCEHISRRINQ
jgi:DNA-directed RNA polymerase subunit RPC12/RpoP